MRYFTKKWWKAVSLNYGAVYRGYHDYIASVKENIPSELLSLEKNYTLHDAEVKRISNNFQDRSATIILNDWD